jgi:GNAT superfamily N-acetyltransferase
VSRYTRPVPLDESFRVDQFSSGTDALDGWLRHRGQKNQASGASRTFVSCSTNDRMRVVGFYSLAAPSVALDVAPGSVRRNMPDPIPVVLLGRLAVHQAHQGVGLGASLLQDAVRRVAGIVDTIGFRALLVHAIDESAVTFYRHFGFLPSPIEPETLFLPIQALQASLLSASE